MMEDVLGTPLKFMSLSGSFEAQPLEPGLPQSTTSISCGECPMCLCPLLLFLL